MLHEFSSNPEDWYPLDNPLVMKILVVEDEPKAGDHLMKGLRESGFIVDLARDGLDGQRLAMTGDYSVIVLGVILPGQDGWQVLRELRRHQDTPVIFLTARSEVENRVKGLELGADDYLVKPFAFSELLARIPAVLRRGRTREEEQLQVADLEMDLVKHRVRRAGTRIDLTPKEFALLALLMRSRGEVLPRTLIAEQVWYMDFDSDTNVIDVTMRRLRAKVDDPFERKLIHAIRGVGYVLEERDA